MMLQSRNIPKILNLAFKKSFDHLKKRDNSEIECHDHFPILCSQKRNHLRLTQRFKAIEMR